MALDFWSPLQVYNCFFVFCALFTLEGAAMGEPDYCISWLGFEFLGWRIIGRFEVGWPVLFFFERD